MLMLCTIGHCNIHYSQDFYSVNYPIDRYNVIIRPFFKSIYLVHRLKETKVFVGFSRLEPRDDKVSQSKKNLRLGDGNWLPAVVT